MSYQTIIYEARDAVALITLNRPERLNAWTYEMRGELLDALARSNEDTNVGAMVVTGAGRGFCAGADIEHAFKARLDGGGAGQGRQEDTAGQWVRAVRESKPIVAAVNGACVGVGLTMILPCDYILASEEARFCCAFVKMGVVTELASSHFLVQRMGFGRASEAALTARMIAADEAVATGLADRLVSPDGLLDEAISVAAAMAANPDRQLRMVKQLLTRNGSEADIDTVIARETELLDQCYASPEHKEAVAAFMHKRKPVFVRGA